MKRFIIYSGFIILILSIIYVLFFMNMDDTVYHVDEVFYTEDGTCYEKSNKSLLNGFLTSNFGDIGLYKNGKRQGDHKDYFDNSKIRLRGNFKDGYCYEGTCEEWYRNGSRKSEKKFQSGKAHGNHILYNENGSIRFQRHYVHGDLRLFKSGGNEDRYKNGKLHGLQIEMIQEGVFGEGFVRRINYNQGKLDGEYIQWYGMYKQIQYKYVYKDDQIVSKACWDKLGNQIICK